MSQPVHLSLALPLVVLALLAGCGPEPAPAPRCIPGAASECVCADGRRGAQSCQPDGTFGACACAAPADSGTPDGAPPDTTPADVAPACAAGTCGFVCDAGYVRSGGACVAVAIDAGIDTGVADTGVADTGVVATDAPDAGPAVELSARTYPWRSDHCTLWTRLPPPLSYSAPIETAEGLWLPSDEGLLLRSPTRAWSWFTPAGLTLPLGDDALLMFRRRPADTDRRQILVRRGGRWQDITPSWEPLVDARDTVYVWGATFAVLPTSGLSSYDGRSWWRSPVPAPGSIWSGARTFGGAPGAFYAAQGGTLWRLEPTRWVEVPSPRAGTYVALGAASIDQVFAVHFDSRASRHVLYRLAGDTLTEVPAPWNAVTCAGGGTPGFSAMRSAPGLVVVGAQCGGLLRLWRYASGAWTELPSTTGNGATLEMTARGALSLGDLTRLTPRGWEGVRDEEPYDTSLLAANARGEVFATRNGGLARLVGDTWTAVAMPALDVARLWLSPEGTLFAVARRASPAGVEVWRRTTAGAWSRDVSLDGTFAPFVARSDRDAYVATRTQVQRWDGTAWRPFLERPAGCDQIEFVGLVGARRALVRCGDNRWWEHDGAALAPRTLPDVAPRQHGPPAAPTISLGNFALTDAGLVPRRYPAVWSYGRNDLFSPQITYEPELEVTFGFRWQYEIGLRSPGVARSVGAGPWTTFLDWTILGYVSFAGFNHFRAWDSPDGRWLWLSRYYRADNPEGGAVARCDFGPR